jgi:hypothetical protein
VKHPGSNGGGGEVPDGLVRRAFAEPAAMGAPGSWAGAT